MNLQAVLRALHESDAGASAAVVDEWDQGWRVMLDDAVIPLTMNLENAALWLHEQTLQKYPNSNYLRKLAEFSKDGSDLDCDVCDTLQALYNSVDRVGVRSAAGKAWEVTFNRTVKRFASLQEATAWLREQKPHPDAIP